MSELPILSSIKVIDYDKTTGEILRTITFPDPIEATTLYPDCLYLPQETDTSDVRRYVDMSARTVVDKPVLPVTLDGQFLRGVPAGSTITIDGQEYVADGTDVELEFEFHGEYRITVSLWPYLDFEVKYEAQA